MEKLVIDRQEWLRKTQDCRSPYHPFLKTHEHGVAKYCCLGLWSRDILEINEDLMVGKGLPFDIVPTELFAVVDGELLMNKEENRSWKEIYDKIYAIDDRYFADNENGSEDFFLKMMTANDRSRRDEATHKKLDWSGVTDSMQEELIKAGFRQIEVEVEFVN